MTEEVPADYAVGSPTRLALAEAITILPEHAVRERERSCARDELTADQFSSVSWLAITMNAFNRISIISGHPVRPRTA